MQSPATTGVGLACEFFSCFTRVCFGVGRNSSVSHSTLPLEASTQSARSVVDVLSPVAVVRYSFPPTCTGDDQARPGIGVFHATFFVVSHSVGTFFAAE